MRWLGRTVWLGLIGLGAFWTGHLPPGPYGQDRAGSAPPAGHPERLVPTALTAQELILSRELGWTR
ncbi:DUF6059 family protein [Streptomyces glaucescens]|uniref:Uncharacterized protein n=1 Tax=Streptomyces glaucescens TaxID=1907 RepID=A0A089XD69_STRGA|nr:DUF6059 family protein [Streptomyces glaucescens]AIS01214.1 hypothetical protein SGLAU_26380 [Streptomyces glaucescens]